MNSRTQGSRKRCDRGAEIDLGQFLKLSRAVSTGGEGKSLIQQGAVRVNGEVETRRGRTLRPGDVVRLAGRGLLRGDGSTNRNLAEGVCPAHGTVPFRNYHELQLDLTKSLNVFVGENAQGKTNLLEAIYLLALGRSHRTTSDEDIIAWGADYARVRAEVEREAARAPH